MPLETELKLTLTPAALPALRKHPLFRDAAPAAPVRWLDNRYYDTPAYRLAAHQVALRLRRSGAERVRTVKLAAPADTGLSSRAEWEVRCDPAPTCRPRGAGAATAFAGTGFADVDDASTRRLLERHAHHLREAFTTRFRRETRRIRPRPGVSVLLMLDRGHIRAAQRRAPICELELELEHGHPADLFELAALFAADLPLRPEDASKADRGYRLVGHRPKASRPPRAPRPAPTAIVAFKRAAARELTAWRDLSSDAARRDAVERRHRVRVALRRLRALLRLYEPALPGRFVARWHKRLGDDARQLGVARELDVLCSTTLRPGLIGQRTQGARLLAAHAQRMRRAAVLEAEAAFGTRAQRAALLRYQADLSRLRGGRKRAAPGTQVAREQLRDLRRRVRRRLKTIDAAPHPGREAAALHRLRLAVKALRDASLLAAAAPGATGATRRQTRKAAGLARLAEDLGALQDIEVARRRLREWANARHRLAAPIAAVVTGLEPRHRRLLARALRRAHRI
jgi:inorganic triphosphatase YgiF